jgi:5'-phosphate synthase pdxT subunit
MVFIRAPQIARIGPDVEVLGENQALPTIVRQGSVLALTFHPELTEDPDIHAYFIESMAVPRLAQDKSKAA